MKIIKNSIVDGKHQKPIVTDVFYEETYQPKKVIIFSHGYKGFKDWGAWDLMAEAFAEANFFFIKFNFSHNGGTVEQPIDFPDLEAFGNNNYTKELDDLESVINWIKNNTDFKNEIDANDITLIGHSRGGGISTIKAEENKSIKKVITLGAISDHSRRFPTGKALDEWKESNVFYVQNGRTKQQMPHFFQFYKNFEANAERLSIKRAVTSLKIPHLIIHGDEDTSVFIEEANIQHEWNPKSKLEIIEGANHVFGASHPWKEQELPSHLQKVISLCVNFLQ